MAAAIDDYDARKRRRRQNGLLLALFAVLLATAIFADGLFFGESETPAQLVLSASHALPKTFARSVGGKHGVTVPIGHPALLAGKGGPENPGDWIDEDGGPRRWFIDGGHLPIDAFAQDPFVLPARRFGSFSSPVGGFRGFPGGIGGGSGGGDGAIRIIPGKAPAPGTVTGGDDDPQGEEIAVIDPSPRAKVDPPFPEALTPPVLVPSSAVPEPQSWMTMIAGFLLVGLAIRSRQERRRPGAAAARL